MRVLSICAAAVAICAVALPAQAIRSQKAVAKLVDLNGASAGTATFTATHRGVLVELKLSGLSPGAHGVHIHTSGNCDRKSRFTAAGPHFSLEPKPHGFMTAKSMHAGDLPNLYAASDGTAHAAFLSTALALGNGKKSLFDRDGAALIVTAQGDDYISQPDGHSGDRIACGVIMRTVGPAPRPKFLPKPHH